MPRRQSLSHLAVLTLCAFVSGCAQLKDDRWTLVWLLSPLGGYLVLALLWAFRGRLRQLRAWDLRLASASPGRLGLSVPVASVATAVLAGFGVYNFTLAEMDPRQRLWNIGLWLLGTLVGGGLGFWLGIFWAEKRAASGEKYG